MRPPWSVTMPCTTARLSPLPCSRGPGGKERLEMCSAISGGIPSPVSLTSSPCQPELAAKLLQAVDVQAYAVSLSRLLVKAGFSFKKTLTASGVQAR